MNDYENDIFVSYAWGGESERTVDELEKAFGARGLRIVRDKKELGYKGSIQAFEQRIGRGQCLILVISDKYLRSKHCMYELVEAAENRDLQARIFPIVLPDAQIYDAVDRLDYIQYWDAKIAELNQAIKNVGLMTNLAEITSDLDLYARIRANFDHLSDLLSDMNTLTPEIHAASGYSTLIAAVESRRAGNGAADRMGPEADGGPVNGARPQIEQTAGEGAIQIGQARDVSISKGPVYHVQGGIHAGRDVIMGNQTNYLNPRITNIQTLPEFVAELDTLQKQITALIEQNDLSNFQRRNLQAAQEQIAEAAAEIQKPQPDGNQLKQTLKDAKETMESLGGGISAAIGLGTALGRLIEIAIQLFGG